MREVILLNNKIGGREEQEIPTAMRVDCYFVTTIYCCGGNGFVQQVANGTAVNKNPYAF